MADARTLAFLEELERADTVVAESLTEVDELAAQVDALRQCATELETFVERVPAERKRLEAEALAESRRVEAVRAELATAERELAAAEESDAGRAETATRHAVVRLRDALGMAERVAGEAEADLARLESEARAAEVETTELVNRAARLADDLRGRPRLAETVGASPGATLAEVADWAGGAQAALFVARGSLGAEREGLIRQASELGAAVLGEQVVAGSPAKVARLVRRSG